MDQITIKKATGKSDAALDLLLLADPSLEMIERYISECEIFHAELSGELVGVLALKKEEESAEIMNVAVKEEFQGRGIGSALITYCIEFARSIQVKHLEIGTADTSLAQLSLYKKLGFEAFDRIENFFVDNYQEPIFENGQQARDMIRLAIDLNT